MPEGTNNQMDINKSSAFNLLDGSIGIAIDVISNEFEEFADNTHHKIVFQIQEEEPDIFAFGVLFALSLMSFTFSGPRGYSEVEFIPDEDIALVTLSKGLNSDGNAFVFRLTMFPGDT